MKIHSNVGLQIHIILKFIPLSNASTHVKTNTRSRVNWLSGDMQWECGHVRSKKKVLDVIRRLQTMFSLCKMSKSRQSNFILLDLSLCYSFKYKYLIRKWKPRPTPPNGWVEPVNLTVSHAQDKPKNRHFQTLRTHFEQATRHKNGVGMLVNFFGNYSLSGLVWCSTTHAPFEAPGLSIIIIFMYQFNQYRTISKYRKISAGPKNSNWVKAE